MSDIRTFIEERLDEIPQDPEKARKLAELLDYALGQTESKWHTINCKHCARDGKYLIPLPKPGAIARTLRELVELTKGRVPEQVNVNVRWDVLPVQELPMEELLRLANREVVEDADYEELPALPPAGGSD